MGIFDPTVCSEPGCVAVFTPSLLASLDKPLCDKHERVCCICAGHLSKHPEERETNWTQTPPIRKFKKHPTVKDGRLWIHVDCWDDLTMDIRSDNDDLRNDIEKLQRALNMAAREIDTYTGRGEIHP